MKKNYIALSLVAALVFSSCSVFKKTSTGNSEMSSVSIEQPRPDKTDSKKNKKDKPQNNDSKHAKMLSASQLVGGQWNITAVGTHTIIAEDNAPYIVFAEDGRFYAGDGCNVLNGDYALRSDGVLIFGSVLSTMKLCPDVPYADLIVPEIADGKSYKTDYRKIGQETYLFLNDNSGKTVLKLRRHNMEFLNGNWQITSAEGKNINDDEANLFIDIAELKVHGNTGCNYFNGDLYIDPSRSNAIDFSNMGLTRMACPKAEQERMIMVALEQTVTAIAGKNDDTVLLMDGNGKQLMTLKRIPMTKNE